MTTLPRALLWAVAVASPTSHASGGDVWTMSLEDRVEQAEFVHTATVQRRESVYRPEPNGDYREENFYVMSVADQIHGHVVTPEYFLITSEETVLRTDFDSLLVFAARRPGPPRTRQPPSSDTLVMRSGYVGIRDGRMYTVRTRSGATLSTEGPSRLVPGPPMAYAELRDELAALPALHEEDAPTIGVHEIDAPWDETRFPFRPGEPVPARGAAPSSRTTYIRGRDLRRWMTLLTDVRPPWVAWHDAMTAAEEQARPPALLHAIRQMEPPPEASIFALTEVGEATRRLRGLITARRLSMLGHGSDAAAAELLEAETALLAMQVVSRDSHEHRQAAAQQIGRADHALGGALLADREVSAAQAAFL